MSFRSALYAGSVIHERTRPRRHRLRYRVFSILFDLDELENLDRKLRLFGYNRRAVMSFFDSDHGDGGRTGLRNWVEANLERAGIDIRGGDIRVLCYPRMFGFVFNPISVYFCRSADKRLAAILYEVSNTNAERHTYVIPTLPGEGEVVRQACRKTFFVSPFIEMDCTYRFRIVAPDDKVVVAITEQDRDGTFLSAVFSGARRPLSDRTLAWALLTYPLMTLKVVAGIHLEALRLWMKGVPVVAWSPAAERFSTSVVNAQQPAQREAA